MERAVIETALTDLWYGFGVALEPHNLMWCFVGVLVGNMVGVLPGMGPLATISILLPLTFGMKPVGAILMLAGVMYGAQYGGAICSILLNLPCHPPHAVTCLDGFPMTKQGRGGVALGVTVIASFVGASWGITEMVFLSPLLVRAALQFGPAEVCSLMLLGLLAGSTLARGSPIKGVAMTVLGLILGMVGSDIETGAERYTLGLPELDDGIELIALALGLFGIAEFMNSINQASEINTKYSTVRLRDMRPSAADLKRSFFPMLRGTICGSLCALIPGTGPTIASFVAYATEKKVSKTPEKFGTGMIEGVACPEAATHSSVQGDFIPTMSLGIPGDAVMALLLGALMIQGIVPGLLDRQYHACSSQRAADRRLGKVADDPLPLSLPERLVLRLYRRLCRQQRHVPGRRGRGDRFCRLRSAAAWIPSGADPARLRARSALRGEFPPRHADLARRSRYVHRAADQRRIRRDVRDTDWRPALFPAAPRERQETVVERNR
jgi:putative tricarboxylic transport membrane protein